MKPSFIDYYIILLWIIFTKWLGVGVDKVPWVNILILVIN